MVLLAFFSFEANGQGYVSPFKTENGKVVQKSRSEIIAEEAKLTANKNNRPYPKEFDKPSKEPKSNGEIWIDGYCRYRPPSYSLSRYNEDMTENEFCSSTYPYDTVMVTDDFRGTGNIPWAENAWFGKSSEVRQLQERIKSTMGDGIQFTMYDSLQKMSAYHLATSSGYKKGREYEFNRSVSIG